MKRRFWLALWLGLIPFSADAALRFGLGDAVAKRSAELIEKAASATPIVGFGLAGSLPACPSGAQYSVSPVDLGTISYVQPLGNLNPTGHTFPSDHIYPYFANPPAAATPLYALQ